jgi:hypothetical protein
MINLTAIPKMNLLDVNRYTHIPPTNFSLPPKDGLFTDFKAIIDEMNTLASTSTKLQNQQAADTLDIVIANSRNLSNAPSDLLQSNPTTPLDPAKMQFMNSNIFTNLGFVGGSNRHFSKRTRALTKLRKRARSMMRNKTVHASKMSMIRKDKKKEHNRNRKTKRHTA